MKETKIKITPNEWDYKQEKINNKPQMTQTIPNFPAGILIPFKFYQMFQVTSFI